MASGRKKLKSALLQFPKLFWAYVVTPTSLKGQELILILFRKIKVHVTQFFSIFVLRFFNISGTLEASAL